jgi:hypothetical protein
MGPLRFELRSEDPQSPRMARLPYGPVLLLLDDIIYVSCCTREHELLLKKGGESGRIGSDVAAFELLDPRYQVLEFRVRDHDLTFYGIYLIQQLPYPHVHQIDDELLDNDDTAKQYHHVFFVCHDSPRMVSLEYCASEPVDETFLLGLTGFILVFYI